MVLQRKRSSATDLNPSDCPFGGDDIKKDRGYPSCSCRTKLVSRILFYSAAAVLTAYAAYQKRGVINRRRNALQICGRPLPFDLSNHDEWPTPYTPSYHQQESVTASDEENKGGAKKEKKAQGVILLKHDKTYRGLTESINGFFHTLDVAYDKNSMVYITRDADWVWDAILPLLYGTRPVMSMKDQDWDFVGKMLGVSVVLPNFNFNGAETHVNAEGAFYARSSNVPKRTIRNRRNTVWRNIFLHSGTKLTKLRHVDKKNHLDVCSLIVMAAKKQKTRPSRLNYSVVDVAWDTKELSKLEKSTGRDLKAASEMSPEYVKDILNPLRLQDKPVYITGAMKSDDKVQKLMNDPTLKDNIHFPQVTPVSHVDTRVIHFAVLADAFIGSPTSHRSLLIAKIRYALGMKNTYLFSKKIGTGYVDALLDDHSDLYDKNHMGLWMG